MKSIDKRRLIVTILLLVLTIAVTALLRIDCNFTRQVGKTEVPAGTYVTLGDACIFLSALILGGPWAALVSAVGCTLADVFVGSYSYILGTFLIKGGMALFLGTFVKHCDTWKKCFVVAAIAEGIMVLGYFIFDLVVFAQYSIAAQEIPINLAQGLVCGALGAVLIRYLPQQIKRARGEEKRRVH